MWIEKVHTSEVFPATLEQLRGHLRLTTTDFDDSLNLYLNAAIATAENYTGQVLRCADFKISGELERSVRTGIMPILMIKEVRVDGKEVCVADVKACDSVLEFPESIVGFEFEAIVSAGYTEIPADVCAAILLIAAKLFENPADSVEQLPKASTNLLRPYRRWGR